MLAIPVKHFQIVFLPIASTADSQKDPFMTSSITDIRNDMSVVNTTSVPSPEDVLLEKDSPNLNSGSSSVVDKNDLLSQIISECNLGVADISMPVEPLKESSLRGMCQKLFLGSNLLAWY